MFAVNPFPFHNPLKTLENLSFSGVFRGNKMGTLSKNEFILVFFSIQQFQVILHVKCHILERWFENKPDYHITDNEFPISHATSHLKSDSHVSEKFCQINIFPSLVRINTIIGLLGA